MFLKSEKSKKEFEVSFNDLALLKELNLLHTSELTSYEYAMSDKASNAHFIFGKDVVIMEKKKIRQNSKLEFKKQ